MKTDYIVYYIARDIEEDRINFMESWLKKSNLNYKRIAGIDVSDNKKIPLYNSKKRLSRYGYNLTNGEIGCFLAHRECWKKAANNNFLTIILENDVSPVNLNKFKKFLLELNKSNLDFDILRLSGIFEKKEKYRRKIKQLSEGFSLVQTYGDPVGAGAYAIKNKSANKLLKKSQSFYQPLDIFLAAVWEHKLIFRTIKPYPFQIHNHGCSDDLEFIPTSMNPRIKPKQNKIKRLLIEFNRFFDDLKKITYKPYNFFR